MDGKDISVGKHVIPETIEKTVEKSLFGNQYVNGMVKSIHKDYRKKLVLGLLEDQDFYVKEKKWNGKEIVERLGKLDDEVIPIRMDSFFKVVDADVPTEMMMVELTKEDIDPLVANAENLVRSKSVLRNHYRQKNRLVHDREKKKKKNRLEKWGGMKKVKLTPDMKLELKAFELRHATQGGKNALENPLHSSDLPEYFQFGTVVDTPGHFYSGRINRKKRKATYIEGLLEEQQESGYIKQRYKEIQSNLSIRERIKKRRKTKHKS